MNILFLCIANSIRSQMAEGLAKNILGDNFTVFSAGSNPTFVHPMAIKVMAEIGIDISKQFSKSISTIDLNKIDKIITLSKDEVPNLASRIEREHWPLINPTASCGGEEMQLDQFRKVRDTLIEKIDDLKSRMQNSF